MDLAASVWSWFYKKCSHRKYLRIAMCKQDLVLVRTRFGEDRYKAAWCCVDSF